MTAAAGKAARPLPPLEARLVLDERNRVAWASPSISALVGTSAKDLLGTEGLALVYEDDRETLRRMLEEMRGAPLAMSLTIRLVPESGDPVPVEVLATNLVEDAGLSSVSLELRALTRSGRARVRPVRRIHHAQTVLDSLQEGVIVVLPDGTVVSCNAAALRLLGMEREALIGANVHETVSKFVSDGGVFVDPSGREIAATTHPFVAAGDLTATEVVCGHRPSGGPTRWYRFGLQAVEDASAVEPVVISFADVTAIREAEDGRRDAIRALDEEREFLGSLIGNLEAGIIACNADGGVTVTNATLRLYGGYSQDEVAVGSAPPVRSLSWSDGSSLRPSDHPLCQVLAGARVNGMELIFRAGPASSPRIVSTTATVLWSSDGRRIGAVAAFQDITAAKQTETELTELALHDPLTGCANRLLLGDRVTLAAELGRREQLSLGLILVDLDEFKQVNDTYGHVVGDDVLVETARRLRAVVRPGDTVARYGGDEFVVLCQISGGPGELTAVCERVAHCLAESHDIGDDRLLPVGASIGTSLMSAAEADLSRLVHLADLAMYEEKLSRRH